MIEIDSLAKQLLTSALRHGATAVAGALVTAGALDKSQTDSFITIAVGAGIWLAGFAWSVYQKNVMRAKVVEAADAPTGTPVTIK